MLTRDPAGVLATAFAAGDIDTDITEIIRPAAIIPEDSARSILVEMALRDTTNGGLWSADPARWARYDMPWRSPDDPGHARLIGTVQIAYGTPTTYEITVYCATITAYASRMGWTVVSLCDAALGLGGLTLAACPRATLAQPPKPLRY
ncbi:MAG: hypothetical protein IPG68_06610 [Micrococcales bacterium]|nr:hypothetical protein [Micrococcales bacterium]